MRHTWLAPGLLYGPAIAGYQDRISNHWVTRLRGKQAPSTGLRRLVEGDAKTAHSAVSIRLSLFIDGPADNGNIIYSESEDINL